MAQKEVAEKFPDIKVDWLAVDRVIAQCPPNFLAKSTPPEYLDMVTVEHHLRKWADDFSRAKRSKETQYSFLFPGVAGQGNVKVAG